MCKKRKAAYCIVLTSIEVFNSIGGQKETEGIYSLISNTKEACAVLGISVGLIKDFSLPVETIKKFNSLKLIPGIEQLAQYNLGILRKLEIYLERAKKDELVLFNIEPKGNGYLERMYPNANICLPGGGLEYKDGNDLMKTAWREFYEEVGIMLPFIGENLEAIAYLSIHSSSKHSVYFMIRCFSFILQNE